MDENVLITNGKLPKTILTKLNELRRSDKYCDLRLTVPSTEPDGNPAVFPVHGCILAVASKTFAQMVDTNMTSCTLQHIDSYNFSLCLDLIYGSDMLIPSEDIPDLLKCAEKLLLTEVVEMCKNSLTDSSSILSSNGKKIKRGKKKVKIEETSNSEPPRKRKRKTRIDGHNIKYESDSADSTGDATAHASGDTDNEAELFNSFQNESAVGHASFSQTQPSHDPDVHYKEELHTGDVAQQSETAEESAVRYHCVDTNEGMLVPIQPLETITQYDCKSPMKLDELTGQSVEEGTDTRVVDFNAKPVVISNQPSITAADNSDCGVECSVEGNVKKKKAPRQMKIKRPQTRIRMKEWLEKHSLTMKDISFDEVAERLGVPENVRPLLEYNLWPDYLHSGRYRGTPNMAYTRYYTTCFKEVTCETCGEKFAGTQDLKQHNKKEHFAPLYCSYCAKPFSTPGNLRTHEQLHRPERHFSCDICDYRTVSNGRLTQHKKRRHQKSTQQKSKFLCSQCGSECHSKSYLRIHEERVHKKNEWKNDPNAKYKCPHCNHVAFRQKELEEHKRNRHSTSKPYVCMICRRRAFKQRGALYGHIRTVHKQEPDRELVNKSLGNVELLPEMPKPLITCQYCNYTTTDSRCWKLHAVVHQSERPFKCEHCSEGFKRRDVLVRHNLRHHGVDLRNSAPYHYRKSEDGKMRRVEGERNQTSAEMQTFIDPDENVVFVHFEAQ